MKVGGRGESRGGEGELEFAGAAHLGQEVTHALRRGRACPACWRHANPSLAHAGRRPTAPLAHAHGRALPVGKRTTVTLLLPRADKARLALRTKDLALLLRDDGRVSPAVAALLPCSVAALRARTSLCALRRDALALPLQCPRLRRRLPGVRRALVSTSVPLRVTRAWCALRALRLTTRKTFLLRLRRLCGLMLSLVPARLLAPLVAQRASDE